MIDLYGRDINYLRISITDRCNLRCRYCMPDGISCVPMEEILTYEEIERIAACASALGIRHIKVTGGEPLVRKDCTHLIKRLKNIPGIETVTLTTNGVLLFEYIEELKKAGVDGINISLDSVRPEVYQEITGRDELSKVLDGISESLRYGIPTKVNGVSLGGKYSGEWRGLVELARKWPLDVRFIELMPIGLGKKCPSQDNRKLLRDISAEYGKPIPELGQRGYGPAVYYRIPGFQGKIGFISAIHGKFCSSCNRVRLTSQGYLKTCLCYENGVDLRQIIRQGAGDEVLQEAIREAVGRKPAAHCFENLPEITEKKNMYCIGG